MVNWGLFKRNFTCTISKTHPNALTIVPNILFNPIDLE